MSGRWRKWAAVFMLEHLLHNRFISPIVLFVGMQPFLVGILQGRRQRRHDLATVTEIAANLSPLLLLANTLKASSGFDGFL